MPVRPEPEAARAGQGAAHALRHRPPQAPEARRAQGLQGLERRRRRRGVLGLPPAVSPQRRLEAPAVARVGRATLRVRRIVEGRDDESAGRGRGARSNRTSQTHLRTQTRSPDDDALPGGRVGASLDRNRGVRADGGQGAGQASKHSFSSRCELCS